MEGKKRLYLSNFKFKNAESMKDAILIVTVEFSKKWVRPEILHL